MLEIVLTREDANTEFALLAEWLVDDRAEVEQGQPVCVVETTKATVEIEAPGGGTIVQLYDEGVEVELEPVLESVGRTGALVTAEEGTLTGGFGAEIAARVQAAAWSDLRGPVQRVAARDGIIPSARPLEDAMLPSANDVVEAIVALEGVRQ